MAGKGQRGRKTRVIETETLSVTTTKLVYEDITRLLSGGYYGTCQNEAIEQLARERLRELLGNEETRKLLRPGPEPNK